MFGWVDFSNEERKRASEIMNLVRYPGAIDELGVGVLRDNFANRLFPATSTLHTHARYYYLVSYLMKDIERLHPGKSIERLRDIQRDGEIRTARRLIEWSKSQPQSISGITGSDRINSGWVKMTPASMDWAAIQRLRLNRDPDITLSGFLRMVAASNKGEIVELDNEDDAESAIGYTNKSVWDVPWSSYKSWNESDSLSLWLTHEEATDLKSRIKKLFPGTAYSVLLEHSSPDDLRASLRESRIGYTSFVKLVDTRALARLGCDESLVALCETAADLASFVNLLHIRFNYVLRKHAGVEPIEDDYAYSQWRYYARSDESTCRKRALRFDADATFEASKTDTRNGRDLNTKIFLRNAHDAFVSNSYDELDDLIEKREISLKGIHRSKIANSRAYANDWFGGYELTYRLDVALMVASEIHMALGGEDD